MSAPACEFNQWAESAQLSSPLEGVAVEVRNKLYSSEYGCLTSFFWSLAELCQAQEVGLISVFDGKLRLRRSAPSRNHFDDIEEEIAGKILRKSQKYRTLNGLARYIWIERRAQNVFLRRIWPADSWRTDKHEIFWLYILAPTAILPQIRDAPGDNEIQQIGGLASAFIRWKNEVFSLHEEVLREPLDDPTIVLQEFKKFVVRPVRPDHFHKILAGFEPLSDPKIPAIERPTQWADRIVELRDACTKPVSCRCHADWTATDGVQPFPCPQTQTMDHTICILAKLEIWRTGFWKNENRSGSQRTRLLSEGIDGLEKAANALHWFEGETGELKPLDFEEGAVGTIGERALVRNFCARAIRMALEKLRGAWRDPQVHASNLEFPARLASLASTLLGSGPWTTDAIQNLLEVVALFGHRVLEIPVRIDLVRHLQQTLRGETALHTLKSRYRDHFFHTLEVCFLGFLLLTSRPNAGSSLTFCSRILQQSRQFRSNTNANPVSDEASKPDIPQLPDGPEQERDFLALWWTAALIHDTAYGIDIFDGTLKLLEFFTNRKEVKELIESARRTVKEAAGGLANVAPELMGDGSLGKGDHGVIAACSLENVLKAIGPITSTKYRLAVRAVAFHNTRYPAVNAAIDPIAALLILCDTVQEWGRSTLGFNRSPAVLLSRMMVASSTPDEEQFGPVRRYGMSLQPVFSTMVVGSSPMAPETYCWKEPDKLRIELDYGEESLRECHTKFTWADMTYNLQRVDFRPWDVCLAVQISTPLHRTDQVGDRSKESNDLIPKTQFDYFGEFIAEQQVRFLEAWFQTANEGNPINAVCHDVSRRDGTTHLWTTTSPDNRDARELLTLNLRELSERFCNEQPLMGGHVGNFGEAIRNWTTYLREQLNNPPVPRPPV